MTLDEDTSVSIGLSGSDPEGDVLTFHVNSAPPHGSLRGTAPNLVYTPHRDYFGTDTFTYTVRDGELTSQPATVTITVNPVNDPPHFVVHDIEANEGCGESTTTIHFVSAGAYNERNQTVTVTATSNGSAVVLNPTISGAGETRTLTFHCAPSGSGTVLMTVVADDGEAVNHTFSDFFQLQVKPRPVVFSDAVITFVNTPVDIVLRGTNAGRHRMIFVTEPASHGTLRSRSIGVLRSTFVYTPDPDYVGPDSFTFHARVAGGGGQTSLPATVTIDVRERRETR